MIGSGYDVTGQEISFFSMPARRVGFGDLEVSDTHIEFMTIDGGGPPIENLIGAIGGTFLRAYIVTVDYPNSRMIVTPLELE